MYNKYQYNKLNDHKVLHKVRKHWIVVSMALLGAIGATGAVKNNASANNINTNYINSAVTNNANNSNTKLISQSNVLSKRIKINGNRPSQQSNSINKGYKQLNTSLRRNALNQLNTTNNSASASQNTKSNSSQAKQTNVRSLATKNWQSLASNANSASVGDFDPFDHIPGQNGNSAFNAQLQYQELNRQFGHVNSYYAQVSNYANQTSSASNLAKVQLSRYSGITGYYDNSSEAVDAENRLNSDIADLPLEKITEDSIDAQYASSAANSLVGLIEEGQAGGDNAPQQSIDQMRSLAEQMNMVAHQASAYVPQASNAIQNENAEASNVVSLFGDASVEADATGAALNYYNNTTKQQQPNEYSNGPIYGPMPANPIANVSNGTELNAALYDPYVKHINIVNNISLWHIFGGSTIAGSSLQDNRSPFNNNGGIYEAIPARDLEINGLQSNGTYDTIDFANYNYNLIDYNPNPGNTNNGASMPAVPWWQNNKVYSTINDLHMYGTNYYGPISMNSNKNIYQGIAHFNNITYDGAQLAEDDGYTSSIFSGHITINGGCYSPNGLGGNQYDYNSGGLSAHPFDGDDGPAVAYANGRGNGGATDNGINSYNDQQNIQVGDGQKIEFTSNCVYNGYTTDGDGIDVDGNGRVVLDHDANVHLTPRGNWAENANYGGALPTGIDVSQDGTVDVNPGATLNITPSVAADRFNHCGLGYNYAPAAIYMGGSAQGNPNSIGGHLNINNGATFKVSYPDVGFYSPSDGHAGLSMDHYSLPDNSGNCGGPLGVITMLGNSEINANPYSTISINGGDPGDAAKDNGGGNRGQMKPGTWGNLIAYSQPNAQITDDHATGLNIDPHSKVNLTVGGNQPITVFVAPAKSAIHVTDPDEFKIDVSHNQVNGLLDSESQVGHTLLASGGVGIRANEVNAFDGNGRDFGQFNDVTLPGGDGAFPSVDGTLPINSSTAAINMIPYAKTTLKDNIDNQNAINHSVNVSQLQLDPAMLIPGTNVGAGGSFYMPVNLQNKNLGVHQIPLNAGAFNLSHGFDFKGVPQAELEGVRVVRNAENQRVITGYATPGAYIRLNENNNPVPIQGSYDDHAKQDYNSKTGQFQAYDPGDTYQYHNSYVAVANNEGFWQYLLPDNVDTSSLIATAHVKSVGNSNAARKIWDYTNGMSHVDQSLPNLAEAEKYYHNMNNFPANTYPHKTDQDPMGEDPTGNPEDPTYTDNDDDMIEHVGQDIYDPNNPDANADGQIHVGFSPVNRTYGINDTDIDDTNAGNYFEAGLYYGTYNMDNALKDNSIYAMPYPFIVGYKMARAQGINDAYYDYNVDSIRTANNYLPLITNDNAHLHNMENEISLSDEYSSNVAERAGINADLTAASNAVNDGDHQEVIAASLNTVNSNITNSLNGYKALVNNDTSLFRNYFSAANATEDSGEKQVFDMAQKAILRQLQLNSNAANSYVNEFKINNVAAYNANKSASADVSAVSSDSANASSIVNTFSNNNINRSSASDNISPAEKASDYSRIYNILYSINYDKKVINNTLNSVYGNGQAMAKINQDGTTVSEAAQNTNEEFNNANASGVAQANSDLDIASQAASDAYSTYYSASVAGSNATPQTPSSSSNSIAPADAYNYIYNDYYNVNNDAKLARKDAINVFGDSKAMASVQNSQRVIANALQAIYNDFNSYNTSDADKNTRVANHAVSAAYTAYYNLKHNLE